MAEELGSNQILENVITNWQTLREMNINNAIHAEKSEAVFGAIIEEFEYKHKQYALLQTAIESMPSIISKIRDANIQISHISNSVSNLEVICDRLITTRNSTIVANFEEAHRLKLQQHREKLFKEYEDRRVFVNTSREKAIKKELDSRLTHFSSQVSEALQSWKSTSPNTTSTEDANDSNTDTSSTSPTQSLILSPPPVHAKIRAAPSLPEETQRMLDFYVETAEKDLDKDQTIESATGETSATNTPQETSTLTSDADQLVEKQSSKNTKKKNGGKNKKKSTDVKTHLENANSGIDLDDDDQLP